MCAVSTPLCYLEQYLCKGRLHMQMRTTPTTVEPENTWKIWSLGEEMKLMNSQTARHPRQFQSPVTLSSPPLRGGVSFSQCLSPYTSPTATNTCVSRFPFTHLFGFCTTSAGSQLLFFMVFHGPYALWPCCLYFLDCCCFYRNCGLSNLTPAALLEQRPCSMT